MNDRLYMKPQKATSRSQQIMARLALLGDVLCANKKEGLDIEADIAKLKLELSNLKVGE